MDTYKKPVHEVCIDKTDCQTEQHRKDSPHDMDKDLFMITQDSGSVYIKPAAQITYKVNAKEIMDGKTCVDCGFRCIQGCV